jgi:endonuclease III
MGILTAELMRSAHRPRRVEVWRAALNVVADRLVAAYGSPTLGNWRDPIREIFFIVLSARTTDRQYRKTYKILRARFPSLTDLAGAPVSQIRCCIKTGGLANKRAGQVKVIARRLLVELGDQPARALRNMGSQRAFEFLTSLPGMGPKSALCVMMYSLDRDAFPVDVNVQRVAQRMGIIPRGLKHYQAQQRLPYFIPAGRSKELHVGLVVHGRKICLPRESRCEECLLLTLCKYGQRKLKDYIGG